MDIFKVQSFLDEASLHVYFSFQDAKNGAEIKVGVPHFSNVLKNSQFLELFQGCGRVLLDSLDGKPGHESVEEVEHDAQDQEPLPRLSGRRL